MRVVSLLVALILSGAVLPVSAQTGRILTAQMVKNFWLNSFPRPETLDRDFHSKKREYAELVEAIRSGALDDDAELAALRNNVAVYKKRGDEENARLAQGSIDKVEARIAEEKRLAAIEKLTKQLEELSRALSRQSQ